MHYKCHFVAIYNAKHKFFNKLISCFFLRISLVTISQVDLWFYLEMENDGLTTLQGYTEESWFASGMDFIGLPNALQNTTVSNYLVPA